MATPSVRSSDSWETTEILVPLSSLSLSERDGTSVNALEEDRKPQPVYSDDALRCSGCNWEIVDSVCQNQECSLEHDMTGTDDMDMESTTTFDVSQSRLDLLNLAGQFAPRGASPPPGIPAHAPAKPAYLKSTRMYHELLARGATADMCARYRLQFFPEIGVIAWADAVLFDEFTGDLMLEGDSWYICLGRRFRLEDWDVDGEEFVTDLVEEATLFQPTSGGGRWETLLTYQGQRQERVWITHPMASGFNSFHIPDGEDGKCSEDEQNEEGRKSDDSDSDGDETEYQGSDDGLEINPYAPPATLFANEYETDSEDEDEDADPAAAAADDGDSDVGLLERAFAEVLLPDSAYDAEEGCATDDETDSDAVGSGWDSDELYSTEEEAPAPHVPQTTST